MRKVKDEWEEFLKTREKEKIEEEKELEKLLRHDENERYEETKPYHELYPSKKNDNVDESDIEDDELDEDCDDDKFDDEDDDVDINDEDLENDEVFENKIDELVNEVTKKREELNKLNNTINNYNKSSQSQPKSKAPAIIIFTILGIFLLNLMIGIFVQYVPLIIIGFLGFFFSIVIMGIISSAIEKKRSAKIGSLSRAYGTIVSCKVFDKDEDGTIYETQVQVGKKVYNIFTDKFYKEKTTVPVFINYQQGLCDIVD